VALPAGARDLHDVFHIALTVVTLLIYLAAFALTAAALGRAFRVYSVATFVALIVFSVLTFRVAPGVDANLPTPFIGVWERVDVGLFLLWVIVLALALLRRGHERTLSSSTGPAASRSSASPWSSPAG
jgi:hypothetical protein